MSMFNPEMIHGEEEFETQKRPLVSDVTREAVSPTPILIEATEEPLPAQIEPLNTPEPSAGVQRRTIAEAPVISHVVIEDVIEDVAHDIEEGPVLGFTLHKKVGRFVERLSGVRGIGRVVGVAEKAARVVGKGAKFVWEKTAQAGYLALEEHKLNTMISEPARLSSRINRWVLMHQAFQEAMPTWLERVKQHNDGVGTKVENTLRGVKFLSIFPIPITAGIPFTEFVINNPLFEVFFQKSVILILNPVATILYNIGKVGRAMSRLELLGVLSYGIPGILDSFIPIFNTALPSPLIDAAIHKHYSGRISKYFEKARAALRSGNTELEQLTRESMMSNAKQFGQKVGFSGEDTDFAGLRAYLVSETTRLENTPVEHKHIDTTTVSKMRVPFSWLKNRLFDLEYFTAESRRRQRIEAMQELHNFLQEFTQE